MHTGKPLRLINGSTQRADRQTGGIGCKDAVLTHHRADTSEERLFDLEILRDALNDKIGIRKAALTRLEGDAPVQLLRAGFGQAAGAHQRGLVVFDESLRAVESFPAPVPKRHAQTALSKNLRK